MSIFVVESYVVKPEKQGEFMPLIKRFLKYTKQNPEKFKEARSWKLFVQMFGGIAGAYVEMWEFKNMADTEKCFTRISKDEGFMKLYQEFLLLREPATHSMNLWNAVMQVKGSAKET